MSTISKVTLKISDLSDFVSTTAIRVQSRESLGHGRCFCKTSKKRYDILHIDRFDLPIFPPKPGTGLGSVGDGVVNVWVTKAVQF